MKRFAAICVSVVLASVASAQPPVPKPGPEYDVLKKFVGNWELNAESHGQKMKGTSSYSMELGGLWLMSKLEMDMGGVKFQGHGMDSYDANKKKYIGVWVDSMGAVPMVMEGTIDEKTKTMTMTGDGTGPDGKVAKHTMTTSWVDDDNYTFKMYMGDEKEPMMTILYKRKK